MSYRENVAVHIGGFEFRDITLDTLPLPSYHKILDSFFMRTGGPNRAGLRVFRRGGASVSYQDYQIDLGAVSAALVSQLDNIYMSENPTSVVLSWPDNSVSYTMLFEDKGLEVTVPQSLTPGFGFYNVICKFHVLRKN